MPRSMLFGPDLIRLLTTAGRHDDAREVLDALLTGGAEGERLAVDILVLRCTGLVSGDEAPIEEARAAHEDQGRRLEAVLDVEARLLVRLASVGPAAKDDVRAGIEQAESAGYALVADRLRRAAAAAGVPAGRRSSRPTFGWDALTKSEWHIVRLVGAGRSNPEIAAELVLSRRTVESHLSRVYNKVAVANRTELALSLRDRELA